MISYYSTDAEIIAELNYIGEVAHDAIMFGVDVSEANCEPGSVAREREKLDQLQKSHWSPDSLLAQPDTVAIEANIEKLSNGLNWLDGPTAVKRHNTITDAAERAFRIGDLANGHVILNGQTDPDDIFAGKSVPRGAFMIHKFAFIRLSDILTAYACNGGDIVAGMDFARNALTNFLRARDIADVTAYNVGKQYAEQRDRKRQTEMLAFKILKQSQDLALHQQQADARLPKRAMDIRKQRLARLQALLEAHGLKANVADLKRECMVNAEVKSELVRIYDWEEEAADEFFFNGQNRSAEKKVARDLKDLVSTAD